MRPAERREPAQQLPKIPPSALVLPEVTPATRLLEKRRQQHEADEALETAKQQYATQEVAFRQREESLKRKDLELQESLLRFTKFLQENDAKRAKANKKAQDEIKLRLEREQEIARLHGEAEECRGQKEGMQQMLQKIVKYQLFLQGVVEAGDTFQEIEGILTRHATLQAANADLRQRQAACSGEAECVRDATARYIKAKSSELLDLNNRLSMLKKQVEARQQEAAALEGQQEYSLRVAAGKMRELGQVAAATANIYQRCLQRSRVAHARDETNPLAQLEVVAHYLGDLRVALSQHGGEPATAPPAAVAAAVA